LAAGASGVVAGTGFLLTHESRAHSEYLRRILNADKTLRTMLFGVGWPAPHRVIPNAATERLCYADGSAKTAPRRWKCLHRRSTAPRARRVRARCG
jgi:NAD(P)H-dependent flavin oxidoreductase YrpB (nitropropane dioxygenase family)